MTTPNSTRSSRLTKDKPKLKLIRKSSRAMQKMRVNKLAMLDFAKRAFKRATRWYARERDLPMGLSPYQIERKVKQEFGSVGPHAAPICHYVHNNLQGMSPLKHGMKGDISPCVFKSLCIAFESFIRIM